MLAIIIESELQLCLEGRRFTVVVTTIVILIDTCHADEQSIGNVAGIPAIGQRRGDGIATVFNQFGNIISTIMQALVIVGPTGVKEVIREVLAIDLDIDDAQRRAVKTCRAQTFGGGKLFAKMIGGSKRQFALGRIADEILDIFGSDMGHIVHGTDPLCAPITGRKKTNCPTRGLRPLRPCALGISDATTPESLLTRIEFFSLIDHLIGGGGFYLT